MNDHGTVLDPAAIRFQRLLPADIETVWAYLTESDKRGQWLASGDMELRVGGGVTLRFLHNQLSSVDEPTPEPFRAYENGVTTQGVITRCEPPRAGLHLGRLARAAVGSPVRTEGPRQGNAADADPPQAGRPRRHGRRGRRLACPSARAVGPAGRPPARPVLVRSWKRCRKTTKPTFRAPDAGASPARRPVSRRRAWRPRRIRWRTRAPRPNASFNYYYRGYQPDKTG